MGIVETWYFQIWVNFDGMSVQRLEQRRLIVCVYSNKGQGVLLSFISYSTTYFTEGRSNLPRDPIASRGMSVPVTKETYSIVIFQGGFRISCPPLDPPMGFRLPL